MRDEAEPPPGPRPAESLGTFLTKRCLGVWVFLGAGWMKVWGKPRSCGWDPPKGGGPWGVWGCQVLVGSCAPPLAANPLPTLGSPPSPPHCGVSGGCSNPCPTLPSAPPRCHPHPGPYLCSSGDSLGAIHLNPASCGRSRAISRAHRAACVPPELPRGQNGAPHGDEHRAKPAPDQHPCTQEPCAAPPCPGHNEAFIRAQSRPHICSALAPRFDVGCAEPQVTLGAGAGGHRGALLGSRRWAFHAEPPLGPDNRPFVEGTEAWAGSGTSGTLATG